MKLVTDLFSSFSYRLAQRYFQVNRNPLRLGKVYKKAIFREFTDATYTVLKAREAWQGILGPTIRGEVGDMAIVHFFNNASMLLSMHPHGSRYIKVHEGKSKLMIDFCSYNIPIRFPMFKETGLFIFFYYYYDYFTC